MNANEPTTTPTEKAVLGNLSMMSPWIEVREVRKAHLGKPEPP